MPDMLMALKSSSSLFSLHSSVFTFYSFLNMAIKKMERTEKRTFKGEKWNGNEFFYSPLCIDAAPSAFFTTNFTQMHKKRYCIKQHELMAYHENRKSAISQKLFFWLLLFSFIWVISLRVLKAFSWCAIKSWQDWAAQNISFSDFEHFFSLWRLNCLQYCYTERFIEPQKLYKFPI